MLPRVSLAEEGGTRLPRLFLDRGLVTRVEFRGAFWGGNRKAGGEAVSGLGANIFLKPIKVRDRVYVNSESGYIHDKKVNPRQPQESQ